VFAKQNFADARPRAEYPCVAHPQSPLDPQGDFVLLHRQAAANAGLLPAGFSGYAFVCEEKIKMTMLRAKESVWAAKARRGFETMHDFDKRGVNAAFGASR
jgi:hypothetical protein